MSTAYSYCFSSPAVLRCATLTRFHERILIIPSILSGLAATPLLALVILGRWRLRRFRIIALLLSSTAYLYLGLSILNLLAYNNQSSLAVFKALDITLAILGSFPPILTLLTGLLLSPAPILRRIHLLSIPLLLLLILFMLAGTVGVQYSVVGTSNHISNAVSRQTLLIGIPTASDQSVHTVLTIFSLVMFSLMQGVIGLLFLNSRSNSPLNDSQFRGKLYFRPAGRTRRICLHALLAVSPLLLAVAGTLGLFEPLIDPLNSMGGTLGLAFTRRMIGLFGGIGEALAIVLLRNEDDYVTPLTGGLRSRIGGPEMSSFRRISALPNPFPDGNKPVSPPRPLTHTRTIPRKKPPSVIPSALITTGMVAANIVRADEIERQRLHTVSVASAASRVTVHFPRPEGAPVLEVRFSTLRLLSEVGLGELREAGEDDSGQDITDGNREQRDLGANDFASTLSTNIGHSPIDSPDTASDRIVPRRLTEVTNAGSSAEGMGGIDSSKHKSNYTNLSLRPTMQNGVPSSSSLIAIAALTPAFPMPPVSPAQPSAASSSSFHHSPISSTMRLWSASEVPSPPQVQSWPPFGAHFRQTSDETDATWDGGSAIRSSAGLDRMQARAEIHSGEWITSGPYGAEEAEPNESRGKDEYVRNIEAYRAGRIGGASSQLDARGSMSLSPEDARIIRPVFTMTSPLSSPLLSDRELETEMAQSVAGIKSIGRVQSAHSTPTPTSVDSGFARGSVAVDQLGGWDEHAAGEETSENSGKRGKRKHSRGRSASDGSGG